MKWLWNNTTRVGFGQHCVEEHFKDFVKPNSRVLVTFGGGSIDKNGARADVTKALAELHCETIWEGGIPPNPEYDRLIEIVKVAKAFKPDLLLAVGGGSILDGTKFISLAMNLDESIDPWDIPTKGVRPEKTTPVGAIITIPATGSEWNNGSVVSRRSTHEKLGMLILYPSFSLLDPLYTMTLPIRQLRNGLFDAMTHCMDQVLTPHVLPMQDNFFFSVMRELVDISGPILSKDNSTLEMHERLIVACSFALNYVLALGKEVCWGIHGIGHMLTAKWGIDHASTLAIISPFLLEEFINEREYNLARAAERVFDVHEGSDAEKAKAFIAKLREWTVKIGQFTKVTDQEGAVVAPEDVDAVTEMVMKSEGGNPFGYRKTITREHVHHILERALKQ
ncbi:alcohol dehydrogenase, iron-containing family protein [Trichomonas vaginalis G3]|uniref:Alcohol dehydrogenase, iron-containing family protein n=1 Tax=Trichomonas vaginalis (strain ATCC PRA-98 / G3) TaxID=412133 RepID=A2EHX8_TRIV3|nr:alcohol dehydrogenase YQHD family [Trichomonas vaginalis G3]EAY07710.1 alcohol dehydrogenase, iron-containing family protein [Trichomonas vaginalis G3]KAI5552555.1 alcohol dehydrogenase YQHD family [Trichomonas vaginalis G3]|eukprot:XP_001319933.1 alcohol dehydrogenase, iron-containing family protein [Trichomonas vaginalis G3]